MFSFLKSLYRNGVGSTVLARTAVSKYKAVQRVPEFAALLSNVRRIHPRMLVEIGTRHGGTFSCWPQICHPNATLISVDLPEGEFGGGSGDDVQRAMLALKKGTQSMRFIRDNSHSDSCVASVLNATNNTPVDFLFIDGDHSLEGVREDFERFSPLVRKGGLIAFHDIIPDSSNQHLQVHVFWNQIKGRFSHQEFVWPKNRVDAGMGIGLLTV